MRVEAGFRLGLGRVLLVERLWPVWAWLRCVVRVGREALIV